ncbi:protein spt2-like isoform X2 [Andrographis paniculata]|uniref:protein spt2-like isoform X2 n=1 Tax=Andrographis paniculata TaxID=175694 RepID=UPI0021E973C2|nr:protein spt2-like isoform X2 [Andrographis paniculata]
MTAMRGYARDEYENWDEYEEDGDEYEEEGGDDGYEEPEQPTQEQLEYLALRQKLKESIRKQMKKEAGVTNASYRDKTSTLRKDNYGSFFGPSQPVIAQRVIQESRSLLENPDLAAKITKSHTTKKKSSGSAAYAPSKPQSNSRPTVVNGVKKKVQMLKDTRDYSFLLSEDADFPAPSKNPPPRTVSTPKSDARPAQVPPKTKQFVNDRGREIPHASHSRDVRKPMVPSIQNKPKVGMQRSNGKLPVEPRKQQLVNNNGSGPGRPLPPKGAPSKTSVPATRKVTPPVAKHTVAGSQRPIPSSQQHAAVRRQPSSQLQHGLQRRSPPRGQSSVVNKSSVQRKEYHETSRPKALTKQPLPPSRDQMRRPLTKPSAPRHEERPKPKPKRRLDDDSDDENAINMIRKMFGYNPNKFRDDDDVSDMEAGFDDIMREEKRSAKIARKEDEEQLRLIEEEERRERMRSAKKKQKVSR